MNMPSEESTEQMRKIQKYEYKTDNQMDVAEETLENPVFSDGTCETSYHIYFEWEEN